MKYINPDSAASDPIHIQLSHKKMKKLRPDLYGLKGLSQKKVREYLAEHVYYGDSQPAIVISIKPLLIAAYSDELDCVAVLNFPENFALEYDLAQKSKLITVNTYMTAYPYQKDLLLGPSNMENWFGFHPIIADFVSEDHENIQKRKHAISDEHWDYVHRLGVEYLTRKPNVWRDGRPMYSKISAE